MWRRGREAPCKLQRFVLGPLKVHSFIPLFIQTYLLKTYFESGTALLGLRCIKTRSEGNTAIATPTPLGPKVGLHLPCSESASVYTQWHTTGTSISSQTLQAKQRATPRLRCLTAPKHLCGIHCMCSLLFPDVGKLQMGLVPIARVPAQLSSSSIFCCRVVVLCEGGKDCSASP